MNVTDLDDHDPALDIGGTLRVPGSSLRVRDAQSPMRARAASSPMRMRELSSPDLGAKRVGFMLDPPASKSESPLKEVKLYFWLFSFPLSLSFLIKI